MLLAQSENIAIVSSELNRHHHDAGYGIPAMRDKANQTMPMVRETWAAKFPPAQSSGGDDQQRDNVLSSTPAEMFSHVWHSHRVALAQSFVTGGRTRRRNSVSHLRTCCEDGAAVPLLFLKLKSATAPSMTLE